MITEHDLQEAIAECMGERNPNAATCRNLAAFYTILDHIQNQTSEKVTDGFPIQSYSSGNIISYDKHNELAELINGKYTDDVLDIFAEIVDVLKALHPQLYKRIIQKLS